MILIYKYKHRNFRMYLFLAIIMMNGSYTDDLQNW